MTIKKLLILSCAIFLSLSAMAQERAVTGRVTGKDGKPIPGVHIVVKGTPAGTVSDEDGNYSITLPDGGGGGGVCVMRGGAGRGGGDPVKTPFASRRVGGGGGGGGVS